MRDALWAELVKIRRSRLTWVSMVAFTVAAGFGGLFMFILADPGRARRLGLLATKAQLLNGTADWPTYFGLLAQCRLDVTAQLLPRLDRVRGPSPQIGIEPDRAQPVEMPLRIERLEPDAAAFEDDGRDVHDRGDGHEVTLA